MAKSRVKMFLSNMLVYGLGGVLSRVVPFLMLPVVTRLMPSTEYYGISDMVTVLVQFGSAIAVLGMYDAMFRLFFEKEDEEFKKEICSTSEAVAFLGSMAVLAVLVLFRRPFSRLLFGDEKYIYLVLLGSATIVFTANNNIIQAPTRMQNKRKIFLVTNTLSPILSYGIAIILLLAGYYEIALPLGAMLSALLLLAIFGILNHNWFSLKYFRRKYLKPLFTIALPLMPNFLIYWIFNSCDRLMITQMIGTGAEGIYAAGGKLGQVSQLIYTAFAGGWQYFAFSTMRDKDQVSMTGHVFEYLGVLSFAACTFMMACNRWIYMILFPGAYYEGMAVVPYLFIAPLLLMLFQTACNQFIVIQKTWPNIFILGFGAVANIGINWLLIPILGIEGAAIGTLIGYVLSVSICAATLTYMKLIIIPKRFYVAVVLFVVMGLSWRFWLAGHDLLLLLAALVTVSVFIWLYRRDLGVLLHRSEE